MTDYTPRWHGHLSTNDAPEVPMHSIAQCVWCHNGLALADGFCSRMCRVESWKANGDESAFVGDPRIAEAVANPDIALVRTLAQTERLLRERAS